MKFKMPVQERIKLSELLAEETASFARAKMIRELREELSLSAEEQKQIGYVEQRGADGRTFSAWKFPDKDPNKEIEIGEIMLEMICKKLKALDSGNGLRQDQIGLYGVFAAEIDKMAAAA